MQFFADRLEEYGNNTALISEKETMTYLQLSQLADHLVERIPERSFAFLICKNTIASIVGYLAFLRKRIAVVLLSSTLDEELFKNLINIYKPQYIWCPNDFGTELGMATYGGYKMVSTDYDAPKLNFQLAVMISTSGSTGSPKYVRLSYENIQSNAEAIAKFLEMDSNDRAITTLPMQYVYGLSIIHSHLLIGASILVTEKNIFDKQFWDLFKSNEVTNFGAVPYTYQMLDLLHFFNMELPSLRYITQAGGSLEKDLYYKIAKTMHDQCKKFYAMYGASEATARMGYMPYEYATEKIGSIGIAIPGGRFELVDAQGRLISEPNQVGELVYYGPNVMLGYATSREDLLKEDELKGRLTTGDFAKRDQDDFYYIVGRANRFVKIYGNRVNLDEIEELLIEKGYEIACLGEDDHVYIYTTSKECKKLIVYISVKTKIPPKVFTVRTIPFIPHTQSGKIWYAQLTTPKTDF